MRGLRCRWPLAMTLGALAVCLLPRPAWAAKNLKVQSFSYQEHHNTDAPVTFLVEVKNNETTTQFAEVDVTVTNLDTKAETTLTPVMTGNVEPGATFELRGTYTLGKGIYTVSFPLFDADGLKTDQVRGKFPLHIGDETESLRVFPEVIHLGTLPPGRTLYPAPVEVRWSYYRFNRLRKDQPFSIRIYTDNAARYEGVPNSIVKGSPAGLISLNGRFVIPLKIWTLNYGPDIQETGWDVALAGPPPVDDDNAWIGPPLLEGGRNLDSASWVRIPDFLDMTANPLSWRRLIGQDPFDNRYAVDSNVTGDFTLKSPFRFYLATEAGPTAVEGSYAATLVVELWTP